jgi:hypothetical protein
LVVLVNVFVCRAERSVGLRFLIISTSDDCEVSHLEGVALLAASLQGSGHAIAHVEIRSGHIRSQVQLFAVKTQHENYTLKEKKTHTQSSLFNE